MSGSGRFATSAKRLFSGGSHESTGCSGLNGDVEVTGYIHIAKGKSGVGGGLLGAS